MTCKDKMKVQIMGLILTKEQRRDTLYREEIYSIGMRFNVE